MIQVTGQSMVREALEFRFIAVYAPFAKGWALSRDRRLTTWTHPGGKFRIQTECVPYEYREVGCVAGLIGECLEWSEHIQRLRPVDGAWHASAITFKSGQPMLKNAKRKLVRRHAS
jgi:hypothetical protein